jgi:hypothetical protein
VRPYTDDGLPLDARFSVQFAADQYAVILESRGGGSSGRPPRNPDYNAAFELLLSRLAGLGATLTDAVVESRDTLNLPLPARRILDSGVSLSRHVDVEKLRLRMTKAAAAVGREPGAAGEGNRTRRVQLLVDASGLAVSDSTMLEEALAQPPAALDSSHASVEGFLRDLIGVELATVTGRRTNRILAVRSNHVVVATDSSPAGRQVPIADVAMAIAQLRNEGAVIVNTDTLTHRSSFIAAVLLQLPGVRLAGTRPARIVVDAQDATYDSATPDEDVVGANPPGPFQGALDRLISARQRREQAQLRRSLLRGRAEAPCALCGESFPARFLWASHIKKRARAKDEEARDLPNIAMLACIFGCDALFEDGYIGVENGKVIGTSQESHHSAIGRRVEQLRGRPVAFYEESANYFDWHRRHVFKP